MDYTKSRKSGKFGSSGFCKPEVPDSKEITVKEYLQKDSGLDLTLRTVSSFLTYSMF